MFYLKFLLRTCRQNLIISICLALTASFSFLLFNNLKSSQQMIEKEIFNIKERSYFQVLYYGERSSVSVFKKLENLPGVLKVIQRKADKKIQKIKNRFESEDVFLPGYLFKRKNTIFEVGLDSTLKAENQELIRSYTLKFLGSDNTVVSEVYKPINDALILRKKKSDAQNLLKVLVFFINIGFIFSFFLFCSKIHQNAYLIEKFQRKTLVGEKSLAFGAILFFLSLGILTFFTLSFNPILSLITLASVVGIYLILSMVIKKNVQNSL